MSKKGYSPAPGTYWLDNSYGPGVWRAIRNGQMQLLNTDIQYNAEYVEKMYGPLTQLGPVDQSAKAPKEQADE